MARTLNVLIVHGIGWGDDGGHYSHALERSIERAFDGAVGRLRLQDVDADAAQSANALRFRAAFWAPVTQGPQDALLQLMAFRGRWPFGRVNFSLFARRQMVGLLGDVISYEGGPHNLIYLAIHGRVNECVEALGAASVEDRDALGYAHLSIIGHSLGSVIASDYVWDHTRGASAPFRLEGPRLALKNMFTLGSPMGLYALRNNPHATVAELAASLDSPVRCDPVGGMWINLYDPQDPIAFPLRPIRSYDEAGVVDCIVRAGSWLTTWNLASHVGYWRSWQVARIVGQKLAIDWAAANSPAFADRHAAALKDFRQDLKLG